MTEAIAGWKKCSGCKEPIEFSSVYYVCSVSTCNRKRTALQFCNVSCWEVHLPVARHREAWAEERTSPSEREAARLEAVDPDKKKSSAERKPRRIMVSGPPGGSSPTKPAPQEVLIVASRLKEYVKAVSGFNTSDGVLAPLSEIVRAEVAKAVDKARSEGRKTILDRDVSR